MNGSTWSLDTIGKLLALLVAFGGVSGGYAVLTTRVEDMRTEVVEVKTLQRDDHDDVTAMKGDLAYLVRREQRREQREQGL